MEITKDVILRSWREESYRESLPEDVRKAIPARPTSDDGGQLSDGELEQAAGGTLGVAVAAFGAVAGAGSAGVGIGELLK